MEIQVVLSTTEAKHITLYTALREQIPFLEMLKEVISKGVHIDLQPPIIKLQGFGDTSGALEMTKLHKIHP